MAIPVVIGGSDAHAPLGRRRNTAGFSAVGRVHVAGRDVAGGGDGAVLVCCPRGGLVGRGGDDCWKPGGLSGDGGRSVLSQGATALGADLRVGRVWDLHRGIGSGGMDVVIGVM